MRIRPAQDTDIQAFAGIYGHYVRNSTATFENDPPDAAAFLQRRADVVARGLPWLVAELESGIVAAFAYASPYRAREAYRFTVEDSIYVDAACLGRGIGSALLPRLIESCEQAGARQMVAIIGGQENSASIRLHAKFGFRHVGALEAAGYKFGRWIDTILMQRSL